MSDNAVAFWVSVLCSQMFFANGEWQGTLWLVAAAWFAYQNAKKR